MTELTRLLVANRGEIAVRIARAARRLGVTTVGVAPEDDRSSPHLDRVDVVATLPGRGTAAYLDVDAVVSAAVDHGCDALHPGYGFLAEAAELAARCADAGVRFVGPSAESLAVLGDKAAARRLAVECKVPVLPGTVGPTSLDEARAFMAELGSDAALMVKAIAGGGGRGMRPVHDAGELADAYERCRSEAEAAFGSGDLYVERLVRRARHLEVQVVGDGTRVIQLGERECSLQRRNQKVIELSPAVDLPPATRDGLFDASLAMARRLGYRSLGTFEFLVDADDPSSFAFIEANARLQVEHTVTEAVTGLDLVQIQLQLAAGAELAELGLTDDRLPTPNGRAVEVRVNTESMDAEGTVRPTGGTITLFEVPSGPGIRVDTAARAGMTTHPGFDSLLAKVICHTPSSVAADAYALAADAGHRDLLVGVGQ
jgi:acetyl/propionyl-CoA carboxylase alpha subunit